jgi:apolipoprotein N-acyltransferase
MVTVDDGEGAAQFRSAWKLRMDGRAAVIANEPRRDPRSRMALIGCALSGALMACATPPMDLYPTAWFGLIAFGWILDDDSRRKREPFLAGLSGGLRGLVFGFGANLVALRFIAPVVTRFSSLPSFTGPVAHLVLSAFEASRWVGAAFVCNWLVRLGIPRVFAFALGVYGGTFIPTMIPWTVACGVCPWPVTVQLAELVGERGVAMLMALEAALVVEGIGYLNHPGLGRTPEGKAKIPLRWRRTASSWGAAGGLGVASLVYGAIRIDQIDALRSAARVASIALVQPAVAATMRWDAGQAHEILSRLTELTLRAEGEGASLVVWPEAAYPFHIDHVSRHAPIGADAILQPGVRGPVLTGLVMTGNFGKYNSAVIATNDGMVSGSARWCHSEKPSHGWRRLSRAERVSRPVSAVSRSNRATCAPRSSIASRTFFPLPVAKRCELRRIYW